MRTTNGAEKGYKKILSLWVNPYGNTESTINSVLFTLTVLKSGTTSKEIYSKRYSLSIAESSTTSHIVNFCDLDIDKPYFDCVCQIEEEDDRRYVVVYAKFIGTDTISNVYIKADIISAGNKGNVIVWDMYYKDVVITNPIYPASIYGVQEDITFAIADTFAKIADTIPCHIKRSKDNMLHITLALASATSYNTALTDWLTVATIDNYEDLFTNVSGMAYELFAANIFYGGRVYATRCRLNFRTGEIQIRDTKAILDTLETGASYTINMLMVNHDIYIGA